MTCRLLMSQVYRGWPVAQAEEDGRRFWGTVNPYDAWPLRLEFSTLDDALRHIDSEEDAQPSSEGGRDG